MDKNCSLNRGFFKRSIDFIKSKPIIWLALICLVCLVFSFGEQYYISSESTWFLFGVCCVLAVLFALYLKTENSLSWLLTAIIAFSAILFIGVVLIGLNACNKKAGYIFSWGIAVILIAFVSLVTTRKLTIERTIFLIFAVGYLLRFVYVLYTSSSTRQHDVYSFGKDGHSGYIKYLYDNNLKLPDFNPTTVDQFYHPPLHHFLSAVFWKILAFFGVSDLFCKEAVQFLPLFYSSCSMIIAYKIFKELKIEGIALIISTAIIAFHPTFIIFAGSINNDILSVTFSLLALLYAIKWSKDEKLWQILICSAAIGLGMMTKLSVYMICLPIALIFAYKFFGNLKDWKKYLIQFSLFLLICVPLAFWWGIRNLVLYDVPITFVQRLPDDSWQYVGDYSAVERLFSFGGEHFKSVYDDWTNRGEKLFNEYNPLISLLKTAVFGEYINDYYYPDIKGFGELLFYSGLVLAIISAIFGIIRLVKEILSKKLNLVAVTMIFASLTMLAFYYVFCFSFPHHCSENIRYVSQLIIFGSAFIGVQTSDFINLNGLSVKTDNVEKRNNAIYIAVGAPTFIFAFASTMLYGFIIAFC